MTTKKKMSLQEKEKQLLKKIEKTKNDLMKLKEKRQRELGKLACDAGLDVFDNETLKKYFLKFAKDRNNGHATEHQNQTTEDR